MEIALELMGGKFLDGKYSMEKLGKFQGFGKEKEQDPGFRSGYWDGEITGEDGITITIPGYGY